jgi:bis(5'-nucleosidyl)-tetraphosphatase/histidine triad (HIT) family protein
MSAESCVFCQRVIKHGEASIIYENDQVMAFMDIAPVEPGHALVIPKKHFANILDIGYEEYLEVHRVTKFLSPFIVKAVNADGINVGQNNGKSANQRVFHYHVHIIPRFVDRELKWGRIQTDKEELEQVADLVRAEIKKNGSVMDIELR